MGRLTGSSRQMDSLTVQDVGAGRLRTAPRHTARVSGRGFCTTLPRVHKAVRLGHAPSFGSFMSLWHHPLACTHCGHADLGSLRKPCASFPSTHPHGGARPSRPRTPDGALRPVEVAVRPRGTLRLSRIMGRKRAVVAGPHLLGGLGSLAP